MSRTSHRYFRPQPEKQCASYRPRERKPFIATDNRKRKPGGLLRITRYILRPTCAAPLRNAFEMPSRCFADGNVVHSKFYFEIIRSRNNVRRCNGEPCRTNSRKWVDEVVMARNKLFAQVSRTQRLTRGIGDRSGIICKREGDIKFNAARTPG